MKLLIKLGVVFAVLVASAGYCKTASAQEGPIPAPDKLEIVSATAYWQIYDSGAEASNFAVLVHYNIDYLAEEADRPTQTIDQLLAFQLEYIDSDNNVRPIMTVQPFPFTRSGYGQGIVGFYVPDDLEGATGVKDSTALRVSIFFFPGYLVENIDTRPFPVEWRPRDTFVTDMAHRLRLVDVSGSWGEIEILDTGNKLTQEGMVYVGGSFPYLTTLAPDLYSKGIVFPDTSREEVGNEYGEELATTGGSEIWRDQFTSTADWLGQPVIMISTVLTLILGLAAAWGASKLAKSQLVTLPALAIVLAGGAIVGFVSLQLIGALAFMGLLVFLFVVVLKRAT